MVSHIEENLFDFPDFRNKIAVFRDRNHAGEVLAEMLMMYKNTDAVVFAIPAGGVPVAAELAARLQISLEIAVVSKITLPWNTEAGYGAIAFDGTIILNEEMMQRLGLEESDIEKGIENTKIKVKRRIAEFQSGHASHKVSGRTAIIVDDGIASGYTMLVAVDALKKAGASQIIIAVPTAHFENIKQILPNVDAVYCANLRGGWSFAVADAYEFWSDVSEEEVIEILKGF
ncbi:phosphoribosyltransferase [Methanobacterium sp. ACI-7]|uniref:phosphoribosyltransferase n=1 Tax=unclassified Methanobacterium TaxID=2627676 RepID=UPI0039C298A9